MSKSLTQIANQLKDTSKKVQLIYAFNGVGKTRLCREFKQLIAVKNKFNESNNEAEQSESASKKILYYNAFTEDLFYWDNDLELDTEPKLKIQPNDFINWILKTQGQDQNIITNFQHYSSSKITPSFNADYEYLDKDSKKIKVLEFTEVTFRLYGMKILNEEDEPLVTEAGEPIVTEEFENIKISKGEESNFIWSIFYTLLDQVINILNVAEHSERETNQFDQLEYVFIDDPVSSLDENHLIELAVNLAGLIKSSQSNLKFIVTTHNPLFYNVLYNELNSKACYLLERFDDGTFVLVEKQGDSNKSFSYHLYLKQTIEQAIVENNIQKYHFILLRNLYEKTANFLGYPKWSELLPEDKQPYLNRIIQFTSHSTLSNETIAEPTIQEKQTVKFLLDHLLNNYGFWQLEKQYG